jgi:Tfp pilus assembly protein FimT
MIVIGILVILTTLTLPYGVNFYNTRALDEETANVASILERARAHAIAGKEDSDWGVQFVSTSQYTIFKGSTCGGTVYQTFNLIQGAEIESEIDCIIFERHTGTPRIYNN